MRDFAFAIIADAAQKAGLKPEKVINIVKKDNLTIPRPRLEIQFLPAAYKRTGRTLAFSRNGGEETRKRELYEVELEIAANVLAEDEVWLAAFCHDFVAALPNGKNDGRGNWIRIRVGKAVFSRPPDRRVGEDVIEVFHKARQLFNITFTGRVTAEETQNLIEIFKIMPDMEK